MTFEPQKHRVFSTVVVMLSVFAVIVIGTSLVASEINRPTATFFDGEWRWVSSQGNYFGIDETWFPEGRQELHLTFSRGRFRAEAGGFLEDWEMVDSVVYEGTYTYADRLITSVPRGVVGRPLELSLRVPLLLGTVWVPQLRGDTLTLYGYMDDGWDVILVRD